ncbi:MAG TPA: outer membrane protein transport protein, partial [Ignavibacteriales bacterium]|nr:outer membrane protein transport protein [Ignavibacteriales bacterium]
TFFGSTTDYSNSSTNLNQFSFAFPFPTIRGSLVFAVGYNRDKDFNGAVNFNGFNAGPTSMIQALEGFGDVSYNLFLTDTAGFTPINGRLNQDGTILSSGSIGRWSFSGAVEVARNVFVGATLNIVTGSYNRNRDYYETDTRNVYGPNFRTDPLEPSTADFQEFYLNDVLNWDISGWDAKVGFIYQLSPLARIGASVKFPTSYTIKEDYTVNGTSTFASRTVQLDPPMESKTEYDISSPYQLAGGASVNLKGLIVSGDITYIDFTQMEFKSGGDLGASTISANNKDIKELFRGVLNYNLGAEYTIPDINLRLRGGFIMNPSPYKDDPSERDRKYLTGGLGFLADEAFAFDLAYAYGWWKDIGDNYGTNVSRTFQDIRSHNLILSVSYRF